MKKLLRKTRDGAKYLLGTVFVLIAAPIIHLSGLNRGDDYPDMAEMAAPAGHDEKMS